MLWTKASLRRQPSLRLRNRRFCVTTLTDPNRPSNDMGNYIYATGREFGPKVRGCSSFQQLRHLVRAFTSSYQRYYASSCPSPASPASVAAARRPRQVLAGPAAAASC